MASRIEPPPDDSLEGWFRRYQQLAVLGVRSAAVAHKIALHLDRFQRFFRDRYGHNHISACLRRDVAAWQHALIAQGLAPATINNHLASLSACTTWIHAHAPHLFPAGDPAKGIGDLGLPPLEPRALDDDQIRTLKNLCDRLQRFHQVKGRRHGPAEKDAVHAHGRPWRDRAIVFVLLSTGLRWEELVRLDLDQVQPNTAAALRAARRARIVRVRGKGKTERSVFLSAAPHVRLPAGQDHQRRCL